MPAINVARTDTFEVQRQKINQIGDILSNISAGGSDLQTGNLKLGDGSVAIPSLSFISDPSLGIYKSDSGSLGFVSDSKKIINLSASSITSFKDFIFSQQKLTSVGTSLISGGLNYDPGTYTSVPLTGGTGEDATVDLTVSAFGVVELNEGSGYKSGTYFNLELTGGFGSGTLVNIDIDAISGVITNAGSGYVPGSYSNVSLINGSGTGVSADVLISGNTNISGSISNSGSGYAQGSYTVEALNTPSQIFLVTANGTTNYIIDGNVNPVLNLLKGNTYRFDVSDSSNSTHSLAFSSSSGGFLDFNYYYILYKGTPGTPGAFVDLVIKPNSPDASLLYDCSVHPGMGSSITLNSGSIGSYGTGTILELTSDVANSITTATINFAGSGYKFGDILTVFSNEVGGGSGFSYTISSVVYTGIVTNVTILDSGINYELGDILSLDDSSVGNGGGSGFQYTVNTSPSKVSSVTFVQKGSGYQVGDQLILPNGVNNISTILPGETIGVSATLGANTTVSVSSTSGIVPGMTITNSLGDIGILDSNTTVVSVGSNSVVISKPPLSSGSASLNFVSLILNRITIADTSNIFTGYEISQLSGNGILAQNTVVSQVIDSTTLELSSTPSLAGDAILEFSPVYGNTNNPYTLEITSLGVVEDFTISDGGNGYFENDFLSVNSENLTQPINYTVVSQDVEILTLSGTVSASNFSVGEKIKVVDGQVISLAVSTSTQIFSESGVLYTSVATSTNSVNGSGLTLNISRDLDGNISTVDPSNTGSFYEIGDTIVISGSLVGGSSPNDDITLVVTSTTSSSESEIFEVINSGSNLNFLVVQNVGFFDGNVIVKTNNISNQYTINGTPILEKRFLINSTYTPNLTFYSGSTYSFDISDASNSGVEFNFSAFRDGVNSPSLIDNITSILDNASRQITVQDTSGILPGMEVIVLTGSGTLPTETLVESVDNLTTLTLTKTPVDSGSVELQIKGREYTDGVTKNSTEILLKVTDQTPSPLYIYSSSYENVYGFDGSENFITVDLNNPKIFGSGFLLRASEIEISDIITNDIKTGEVTAVKFISEEIQSTDITNSNVINSSILTSSILNISEIYANSTSISLNSNNFNINSNLNVNSLLSINSVNGNLITSGEIKTFNRLNVNDSIFLFNNEIQTSPGIPLILKPASNQSVNISGTSALGIPVGNTSQRPNPSSNGYIRFNSQTNQYEGYSSSNGSWSSLGGVRDLDGNTTILAEESVGSNDNTLWFINDNINTVRFTPQYQEFVNVKKIRSVNTSAPDYVTWTANTPVTAGDYLKYRNNIYEVITGGTTATSGSEPTNTSGDPFSNGTATLQFATTAVAQLTFEEISQLNIDPLGFTDLVVNGELRFSNNVISTDVNDLVIRPNSGQKVSVNSTTSLAIPVGDSNSRGNAARGSIRYNTTDSQFEGYNGSQWGGLGGVKDVDQDTRIDAETGAGNDEDILYFFNAGNNTLRLTTTQLEFGSVDTIISSDTDTLNINTSTVTFDSLATTINNSESTRTFISTSKDNLDIGLSTGLNNDHLLRLKDTGEIVFNLGFGTGTPDNLTVLNSNLTKFELKHTRVSTSKIPLVRGALNSGNSSIYSTATESSAKVCLTAHNTTTGDKELVEYYVIDDGTDVYFTDYNNVKTGPELVSTVFDIDPSNNVRITFTLDSGLTVGDNVTVTLIKTVTKR